MYGSPLRHSPAWSDVYDMNEKIPKVSVVIPVYNTASYLRQCIDSVLGQTLHDIEVICVENGSTDNSPEILKSYEATDNRLRVIVHPEGRLGGARNAGLDRITGEYVGFVDSDDYIKEEMYEATYSRAVTYNADLAICGVMNYFEKDGIFVEKEPAIFQGRECVTISENRWFFRNLTAWNKLYKRDFLERNSLRFPEGTYYEDQLFVTQAYLLANRIAVVKNQYYFYRKQRSGQISTLTDEHVFDIYNIFRRLDSFAQRNGLDRKFVQDIGEIKIQSLFYLFPYVEHLHRRRFFEMMKDVFKEIKFEHPPHFISNTLHNNFQIVKTYSYSTAVLFLRIRECLGKVLCIPILRNIYIAVRGRFGRRQIAVGG
jgi:glycosyltransferase involved in cell wall biosynthesis